MLWGFTLFVDIQPCMEIFEFLGIGDGISYIYCTAIR